MKRSKILAFGSLLTFSLIHFTKIGFIFLFLSTLKKFRYTKKRTFFIFLFFSLLIIGSLLNGANISNVLGKILKVYIILKFFELRHVYVPSNIHIVIFLILHFIFSFFYYEQLDEGFMINRFSGFFYDSNFAGFTLLCLYLNEKRTLLIKILIFLSLLLTQSVGAIFIFALIYLGIIRLINKNILILIFIIIHVLVGIFLLYNNTSDYIINDFSSIVDMKVNSLFFRFAAINSALFTSLPSLFDLLFGHGSGVASVIYGRTFHNYIFQTIYDHGLIFFFSASVYLWKNISKRNINIILIILASNLLYETIWSLGFLIFLIFDDDEI